MSLNAVSSGCPLESIKSSSEVVVHFRLGLVAIVYIEYSSIIVCNVNYLDQLI